MAALLEAEETVAAPVETVDKWAHLRPYQFKPGHAPPATSGRPKGAKSWTTVLADASPKLAKKYVKTAAAGAVPLLLDSRKIFLPIDSDAPAAPTLNLLTVLVQAHRDRLSAPTRPVGIPVAAPAPVRPSSSTLTPSASTEVPTRTPPLSDGQPPLPLTDSATVKPSAATGTPAGSG